MSQHSNTDPESAESVADKLEHLAEGVAKLRAAPRGVMGYADCAMLLFDAARVAGFDMDYLLSAMWAKHRIRHGVPRP